MEDNGSTGMNSRKPESMSFNERLFVHLVIMLGGFIGIISGSVFFAWLDFGVWMVVVGICLGCLAGAVVAGLVLIRLLGGVK